MSSYKSKFFYPPGEIPQVKNGEVCKTVFLANADMSNKIIDIANERYRSKSDTIRLLVQLGMETYTNNKIAGRTNYKKNQQHRTKQAAEAKAIGAERERKKSKRNGKEIVPAVTPLLLEDFPTHR